MHEHHYEIRAWCFPFCIMNGNSVKLIFRCMVHFLSRTIPATSQFYPQRINYNNFKRVAGGKTGRSFAYIIQENQSMSSSLSLSAK